MNAIINTNLVTEDGIIYDGVLLFENGVIKVLGKRDKVEIPEGARVIDAKGKYTAPGFIDIHCHGANKDYYYSNPIACSEHFIAHGVTTVLPTFYMNMSLDEMIEAAENIRNNSKSGVGRIMDGLYMEAPYMNFSGSHRNSVKWDEEIRAEDYVRMLDSFGDLARVWAIDPAREGIDEFMAYTHNRFPKAVFALGHSSATFQMCKRVEDYGVRVQTHHGDSGKAKGLAQGTRGAGCDEYTLYNPDMYAELICDATGIHVTPDMVKMVIRTKGVEKMILISDSTTSIGDYKNDEASGIAYGPDLNYDDEGKLAGSKLTLDNACLNVMTHTGYGICHAVRMATYNPAKMLGIDDKVGSLKVGRRANIIIIDDKIRVNKVFLEGDLMVNNE